MPSLSTKARDLRSSPPKVSTFVTIPTRLAILLPNSIVDLQMTDLRLGLGDLCEIGDESRPKLFDLNIRKPKLLFDKVVEATERVTIENYELNPFPTADYDERDPALVKTDSGEIVRVLQPLDADSMRATLRQLRDDGFDSVAICFIHSHIYPGEHPVLVLVSIIADDLNVLIL